MKWTWILLLLVLGGCGLQEAADEDNRRTHSQLEWQSTTIRVGARWTSPPDERRHSLVEANPEYTKYRVNPYNDPGHLFVTVKRDTVVSIWSTLQIGR
jgi:hypothetical protein